MNQEISNNSDLLDTRDIIERIEWLESSEAKDADEYQTKEIEEFAEELTTLMAFMDEMKGMGGDEQWRGDWYPITLVHDSYFEDFARDEAEQLVQGFNDMQWPFTCIDWAEAAEALQQDYSEFDFDGQTYWGR